MAGRDVAARRCGLLGRSRRRRLAQAPDQVGDVGEFLLQIALVALEPLDDVLLEYQRLPNGGERRPRRWC